MAEKELKDKETQKVNKPVRVDENTLIKVKSTVYGVLVYVNKRNGDVLRWETQGEIKYVPLRTLIDMRNDSIAFFKNQWLIVVGVGESEKSNATPYDIYSAVGVKEYYKNFIDPTNCAEICAWDVKEIKQRVETLSPEAKENLIVALNKLVRDGELDSLKEIRAFEETLGCELTDGD